MFNVEFANLLALLLLIVIPLLVWRYLYIYFKDHVIVPHTYTVPFLKLKKEGKFYLKHIVFLFEMIALSLIILALARPQSRTSRQNITSEGINIVLALDISSSMLARDLKPNRLEASKNVALSFIKNRPQDRIGLVVYAGESFTQCPLTTDHSVLKNLFSDIKQGMIEDGTAIGSGLSTAISRLKDSKVKSKVIILITDGSNNKGDMPPITAAEIAKTFGIRVYTIGVGTNGEAEYPVQLINGRYIYKKIPVKFDEVTLRQIAGITNGKYFRATNNEKFSQIYNEIDAMEKSKIKVVEFRKKKELFRIFLIPSVILLIIVFLLKKTYLKSIV